MKNEELKNTGIGPGDIGTPEVPVVPSDGLTYSNPYNGEYPIVAYNNVQFVNSDGQFATDEEIREVMTTVKQCGFNVNLWISGSSGYESLLNRYFNIAESLGIRTVMSIAGWIPTVKRDYIANEHKLILYYEPRLENTTAIFSKYIEHKNLWGYFLMDEPKPINWQMNATSDIPACQYPKDAANLALFHHIFRQNNNNRLAFFNLAVSVHEDWIGGDIANLKIDSKAKYIRYLRAIKDKLYPLMMSVDYYPVIKPAGHANEEVKKDYYLYMEAIGNFMRIYKTPMWMFMLTSQHTIYYYNEKTGEHGLQGEYPLPTVGNLRFQALTAIAYGFQGLVFWTYSLKTIRKDFGDTGLISEEYFNAPYVDGRTTEIWDNCKSVIPEIKQYGKPLLGATFTRARHVYGPNISEKQKFEETTEFDSLFGCIAYASTKSRNGGFVITQLKKGDTTFMAIVSHDPWN